MVTVSASDSDGANIFARDTYTDVQVLEERRNRTALVIQQL
jgi:hypothetical protein